MDFIRITKRDNLSRKKEILITLLAIVLSIVFAGIILLIFGLNPFEIFKEIIMGSVGTGLRVKQTIVKAVPLIITSMGIIVAFKMKFWNIGAEGQITMGALGASWVALNLSPNLPQPVMLLLMMIGAAVCGGIWAFIPAIFKAKLGTNETIFTLMMNYVAIKFVTYLQYGPWMDPGDPCGSLRVFLYELYQERLRDHCSWRKYRNGSLRRHEYQPDHRSSDADLRGTLRYHRYDPGVCY